MGSSTGASSTSARAETAAAPDALAVPVALTSFSGKDMYLFLDKRADKLYEDVLDAEGSKGGVGLGGWGGPGWVGWGGVGPGWVGWGLGGWVGGWGVGGVRGHALRICLLLGDACGVEVGGEGGAVSQRLGCGRGRAALAPRPCCPVLRRQFAVEQAGRVGRRQGCGRCRRCHHQHLHSGIWAHVGVRERLAWRVGSVCGCRHLTTLCPT